jgi:hypothetical protein
MRLPGGVSEQHGRVRRKLGNQYTIRLPSSPCVPDTLAHDESSGHVRVVQLIDEPMRLLKRDGFVRVYMNENRGRSVGGDVRHGREAHAASAARAPGLPNGAALDESSFRAYADTVDRRLALAGLRLADAINSALVLP